MLKIDSSKKAIVAGVILGFCVFFAYALFTCLLHYLFNGEHFIDKGATKESINGISFSVVQSIAVVISAVIPILLIRYKKVDYYVLSIFIAVALYILFFVIYIVYVGAMPIEKALKFPMNSFDALYYGIFNFPLGAVIGILVNAVVNFFVNKNT